MSLFTAFVGSKIAVGLLAAGVVGVGGVGVAAAANVLPPSIQQGAHDLVGAPAPLTLDTDVSTDVSTEASAEATSTSTPSPTETPTAAPVGPDATGPAAVGLCTAYAHGGVDATSTAYTSLVTAASGSADIAAYCATIVAPGNSASHRSTTSPAPTTSGQTVKGHSDHTATPQAPGRVSSGVAHTPVTGARQ